MHGAGSLYNDAMMQIASVYETGQGRKSTTGAKQKKLEKRVNNLRTSFD